MNTSFESYLISVVRPLHITTRDERQKIITGTKFNLFKIPSNKVMFDLLTDSGTGAISNAQLSEIISGDESYAGSASFEKMQNAIRGIMGFDFVIPTHQGRGAEHVLTTTLVKPGDIIPGNSHFDTTKGHIEYRQGTAVDCTITEARDPLNLHPFKGNVDLGLLEDVLKKNPRDKIPFVIVTITCNTGGGQPVSLANLDGVKALCKKYGVRLIIDAARFAENAYFIKTREPACRDFSIREIVKKIFSDCDGVTMSAKKDAIVAMGGFFATNDPKLYELCSTYSILFEGYLTYGGMTGGTMAALAQGLFEATEFDYLKTRVGQVQRFGEKLIQLGVPIILPVGGHAVYLDALKFVPYIPRDHYPAQALAVASYIEGGVRPVEVGCVLADRDPVTRKNRYPALELVRLAIPRRTFTDNHLNHVAQVFGDLLQNKNQIRGLKITHEAPVLRHFTCEFEQV